MESYIVPGLKEAVAHAVDDRDWTPVKTLLEGTLPKNSVEYRQLQQIHVNDNLIEQACSCGFTELVSVFLSNGFPVNCIVNKSFGERMLHLAVYGRRLSLVKMLLNVGAEIDCKAHNDGKTPLFYAVYRGYLEIVKHLISVGADVNTCDKYGRILLDAKHIYNTDTEEMLQLLLEAGCDPSKSNSCHPLNLAVWSNNVKYVKMLLEAGAHVISMGRDTLYTPLHIAAHNGNVPVMQLLLDYGADINARDKHGDTALHTAVENGNLQSVKILIEHGSLINSVNAKQKTPLLLSIIYEHFDIAMLLINSGAVIDLDIHHTLLHDAINVGAPIHVIECLLEHGANVTTAYNNQTAVCYNETTPLQYVIFYRYYSDDWNFQVAKLLLIYGSDHYVEDGYGNTVLHWACEKGDLELVEYLIYYGLNVDAKNREGKKPIDIAHERGYVAIVNIIIEYHCNKYSI